MDRLGEERLPQVECIVRAYERIDLLLPCEGCESQGLEALVVVGMMICRGRCSTSLANMVCVQIIMLAYLNSAGFVH